MNIKRIFKQIKGDCFALEMFSWLTVLFILAYILTLMGIPTVQALLFSSLIALVVVGYAFDESDQEDDDINGVV